MFTSVDGHVSITATHKLPLPERRCAQHSTFWCSSCKACVTLCCFRGSIDTYVGGYCFTLCIVPSSNVYVCVCLCALGVCVASMRGLYVLCIYVCVHVPVVLCCVRAHVQGGVGGAQPTTVIHDQVPQRRWRKLNSVGCIQRSLTLLERALENAVDQIHSANQLCLTA